MSQLTTIFVVMSVVGSYGDQDVQTDRAFLTKDEADRYVRSKWEAICFVQGMESAIAGLMTRYDEMHPSPVAPTNYDSEKVQDDFRAADAHWNEARRVYENMLFTSTGCEKARLELFGERARHMYAEEANWYVKEVPVGL